MCNEIWSFRFPRKALFDAMIIFSFAQHISERLFVPASSLENGMEKVVGVLLML